MPGCGGWDGVAPLPPCRVVRAVVGQRCAQRGFAGARAIRAGFLEVVGLRLKVPNRLGRAARVSLAASFSFQQGCGLRLQHPSFRAGRQKH